MSLTRDQILAALPGLAPADLKAISAALSALTGQRATGDAEPPKGLPAAIFEALQAASGTPLGWAKFSRSAYAKQFDQNAPVFAEFMTRAFGKRIRQRTAALAVAKLLLRLLATDLRHRHVPISIGSLTTNMARIADVFEHAYPGYLESNLCGLIWSCLREGL